MLISGEDIPVAYDRFRHRVMFPITDLKGRVIAFGGRALDPDALPAAVTSQISELARDAAISQGPLLFNAANARGPAPRQDRVIAVEGYMDVIALTEAGFEYRCASRYRADRDQSSCYGAWFAEPILCFDGDSAGQKAAFRAVDTVLPHLTAGHSVAFAFLPDGLDPDDLIRQQGPEAMEAKLAEARPLVDVLWQREWAGGAWTTPERRAQLEAQLRQLVGRIHDASVRSHYERDIRQRFNAAFGITERVAPAPVPSFRPVAPSRPTFADEPSPGHFAPFDASEHPAAEFDPFEQFDSEHDYEPSPPALMKRETSPRVRPMQGHGPQTSTNQPSKPGFQQDRRNGQGFRGGGPAPRNGGSYPAKRRWPPTPYDPEPKAQPSSALRSSRLANLEAPGVPLREALLLRTVLNHPWLIEDHAEQLAELPFTSSALSRLRDGILSVQALDNSLDSTSLRSQLSKTGFDRVVDLVERAITHKSDRFAEPDAERTEVQAGWRHALEFHSRQIGLRQALEAAERAWYEHGDEEAQARIYDLQRQLALSGATGSDPSGSGS